MIEVRVKRAGCVFEVDIKGHADYTAGAPDVVCAAVSALAYTLIGAINNSNDSKIINHSACPGDFNARFFGGKETRIMLDTVLVGLMQIAHTYPDNVRVEEDREPSPRGIIFTRNPRPSSPRPL